MIDFNLWRYKKQLTYMEIRLLAYKIHHSYVTWEYTWEEITAITDYILKRKPMTKEMLYEIMGWK